jgi:hypothetical protein
MTNRSVLIGGRMELAGKGFVGKVVLTLTMEDVSEAISKECNKGRWVLVTVGSWISKGLLILVGLSSFSARKKCIHSRL